MFAVTGLSTTIVRQLEALTREDARRIQCLPDMLDPACGFVIPHTDRYLLAAGVLHPLPVMQQTPAQMHKCIMVNLVNTIRLTEAIFAAGRPAHVVLIGSMSAFDGSFDELYAATKAGAHAYVRHRRSAPGQLLTAIAPPIISDSGMTRRRADYPAVLERRRTVTSAHVAEVVLSVWRDPRHVNGAVVRL